MSQQPQNPENETEPTATGDHAGIQPDTRTDDSVQQMSDSAKQIFTGAKDFFQQKATPAVSDAIRTVQGKVRETNSRNIGRWALFALPAIAFFIILSLFLPVATMSAFGVELSVNYFSEDLREEGILVTVLMVIMIALAAMAIILQKKWTRFVMAGAGILFGFIAALDGFGSMARMSDVPGATVGAGLVFLALFGALMVVSSILVLVLYRGASKQGRG